MNFFNHFKKALSAALILSVLAFASSCGEDGNTSGSAESMGMISDAESKTTSHPVESEISDAISKADGIVSDIVSGAGDAVSDIVSGAGDMVGDSDGKPNNP